MVSAPGITLWGIGTSRTMRAHWTLHELSLDYMCEQILPRSGQTQTAQYTALNPRQKVPMLEVENFKIGESAAIAAYLAQLFPDKELVPKEPLPYARWLEWCFFIVTELDATSLYVMRRHSDLQHVYGAAPAVVDKASEYFLKQLHSVEIAMGDARPYLCGAAFTTADILLTTCLTWAVHYRIPISPVLHDYLRRITSRPAYREAFRRNRGDHDAELSNLGDWRLFA